MRLNIPKRFSAAASLAAAFAVFGASVPALAQSPGTATSGGWEANDDDFLLLEAKVKRYRLNGEIRGYQTDRGVCFDFADIIQSFDIPVRLDKKSRRATGWLFAEDQTFTIDRASNTVQNVNGAEKLANGDIYDTPEGWCIDSKVLSRWFGVTLKPDLMNAAIRIEDGDDLPFIAAIERKSRAARLRPKRATFDLSKLDQAEMPYRSWRTPSVDAVVSVGVDVRPNRATQLERRYELFSSGEVAGASFDARLASDRQGVPDSLRLRAYKIDPEGGMLGPLDAKIVALGDVETPTASLTGQTAVGRGAYVSNRPPGRGGSFSTTTLRGTLPAGWDAELYRNGQLLAYQGDRADGRYEFIDVELLFGQNALEVVLYGPQGQIRRERTSLPVGLQSIAPGEFQYWAGIVEQDRDLIDLRDRIQDPMTGWRGGIGLERGFDQRTMGSFGLQSIVLGGVRRNYAEASVLRSVGPMLVELSAAQEFGRGRAYMGKALGKIGKINFQADTLWVDGGFESELVSSKRKSEHSFTLESSLKLGKITIPVQAGVAHSAERDGTKVTEVSGRASISGRNFALTTELSHVQTDGIRIGPNDGTRLRLLANTRVAGVRLRGEADFKLSGREKGFRTASLVAEKSLNGFSDLAVRVDHDATVDRTSGEIAYVRQFEDFSLSSGLTAGTDGSFGGRVSLNFSFGPNPTGGGIRFSRSKLARTGQASVTVFRDDNGDGRRSAGEQVLENVGVEAGFRTTESITNSNGQTVVDGLKPYVPVVVGIDEASLDDPFLAAGSAGVVVTPRPGVAAQIELAVTPTGEVEGMLHSVSDVPRGGVRLELVNAKGAVAAQIASEFDGFFLFDRVPYGTYRLQVLSDDADILDVRQSLSQPFTIGREMDIKRFGVVRMRPAAAEIALSQ
ncbi:carboxypeptidase regulatory-like domain-containing protein [Altererythrobacter sp. ZODW24]|uniref:MSCRAMM family protein n=1 Tax=Altererythrobacter sp. ZODW24 TaxID=2185142 RepID=UPI000DF7A713|nr:carboxypeptidase regulatory-like domain-containing protein [Altererythrobacter sp. ZODW24]